MTKEKIADLSIRLGAIANDICSDLNKAKVKLREKFYLGMLGRQSMILRDINRLLVRNELLNQTSTFILFRCLLDDFITILYLESKGHSLEEIIKHTASAFNEKFKMIKESARINDTYFEGKRGDLATMQYYNEQNDGFKSHTDNAVYLDSSGDLKTFPNTSNIIRQFRMNDETHLTTQEVAAANAHALVLWQLLSKYVHYSYVTYELETSPASRQIEIDQLKEVLNYCYKTIMICSAALNNLGLQHQMKDPTNVKDEIFEGYISATDH